MTTSTTIKRDSMDATTMAADQLSTHLKSTTLSSTSTSTSNPQRPSPPVTTLASLPLSILNAIFSHLLDTELINASLPPVSYTSSLLPSGTLSFKPSRPPFPVQTSLFCVNRRISELSRRYLYAQNLFIRLEIKTADARHARTMLSDSGVLFSAAAGADVLGRVEGHAMDIVLVEKGSDQTRAVVMFPAQYLPRLVNFMDQASKATKTWAGNHRLRLSVKKTYAFPLSRLQGDLLEPFRFLAGFDSVVVERENLLPGFAEGLEKGLTSSSRDDDGFNAASWLDTVGSIVEHADAAKRRKEWDISRPQYESAIIAVTYAYLTHPEHLHSQDEAFARGVQRLRWRCELGVGIALLSQHGYHEPYNRSPSPSSEPFAPVVARDLLNAESRLSSALSLSTNSPSPTANPWIASLPVDLVPPNHESWFTDSERGESWYELGLAHAALSEFLFAAGDLERAIRLVVHDSGGAAEKVENVFEWVREQIDWEKRPGDGLRAAGRMAKGVVQTM